MKSHLVNAAVTAFVVSVALLAYDRVVVRPALRVGVVDISAVYASKENEFAQLLLRGGSDQERQRAMAQVPQFAQRLSVALDELPRDCDCLVVLRSAVAGMPRQSIDLTPYLKAKVGDVK